MGERLGDNGTRAGPGANLEARELVTRLRGKLRETATNPPCGGGHEGNKGALRMNMCVRVRRGLVVAGMLLAVALFGVPSGSALAQPAETGASASAIVVEGNRRVDADTIRSYFRVAPGEHIDAAKIDSALKALYASGLFQDIRISHSGSRLVVTVVEAPVIDRLAFEGNNKIKDEQLTQEMQSKAARYAVARHGAGRRPAHHRGLSSQRALRRPGGPQNHRTAEQSRRPDFRDQEGEKTGVKSIIFVGNHAYSDYRLKEVIKTSTSNFLSFLQTTDVYDPDRIEADRDLLRRFYLSHGYADVQVVSAVGEYDPAIKGFIITFTIEEGQQYRFGTVEVQSNIRAVNSESLRHVLRMRRGDIYNSDAVEKTVEDVTVEISKHGYPFATVRPRGDRNPQDRTISVVFLLDEGARAYIERINIRGNTRTREYVIRREFDISEGDPYNRALVDRAERRIKSLGFFKTVKITNEPGSAPDRVVINVDVEEQSTGDFSVMGGYSTADGFMAQVSISERNLLGTGRYAKASVTYGQYIRGAELSFVEPYFLDQRLSGGIDLFGRAVVVQPLSLLRYRDDRHQSEIGVPLREDLSLQLRYSVYWNADQPGVEPERLQQHQPEFLDDLSDGERGQRRDRSRRYRCGLSWVGSWQLAAGGTEQTVFSAREPATGGSPIYEASLPVRYELAQGGYLTSLAGYGLTYNTLDNNKHPTSGILVSFGQDFAGLGGDAKYIRSVVDMRGYYEVDSRSRRHPASARRRHARPDQLRSRYLRQR